MSNVLGWRITEAAQVMPECQAAFLPGPRTIDNVLSLSASFGMTLAGGLTTARGYLALFCDQEKAYDRVDCRWCFDALLGYGVPPADTADYFETFYGAVTAQAQVRKGYTPVFSMHRGVLQGNPASTILYNIALQPLLTAIASKPSLGVTTNHRHLPSGRITIPYLAFADDVVLFADSNESFITTIGLIVTYEGSSGAKLNRTKTKAVWIGSEDPHDWVVRQTHFPVANRHEAITLLGHTFPQDGTFDRTRIDRNFAIAAQTLAAWTFAPASLDLVAKVQAAITFLLSKLWYRTQIGRYTSDDVRVVERFLRRYLFPGSWGVALRKIVAPKARGGLGLIDPTVMINAMRLHLFLSTLIRGGQRGILAEHLLRESFLKTRRHPYH